MKRKNKKNQAAAAEDPIKETAEVTAEIPAEAEAEQPAEIPAEAEAAPLEETAPEAEAAPAEAAEESAPAEEAPKAKKAPSPLGEIIRITLPLTVICLAVALMLALVNAFTSETIAANAAREKEKAVLAIFPEGKKTELLSWADGNETFLVIADDQLLGCCVSVSENGFGGAINMMVGFDCAGAVKGVRVISLSETPGIGTKVKSDSFLTRFSGSEPFVIGENFDAISGATISSKAMVRGVNRALAAMPDLAAAAEKRGLKLAETPAAEAPAETDSVLSTETVVSTAPTAPSPITAETEKVETVLINLAAYMPTASVSRTSAVNNVRLTDYTTTAVPETTAAPETTAETETSALPETTAAESESAETAETSAPADSETIAESETTAPAASETTAAIL